jgi:putative hydrolase of the HAD superfamily
MAPPRNPAAPAAGTEPLSHVRHWVFDLDNTLYPATCDLFRQIDRRMGAYIARLLALGPEEARRVQKRYFRAYGTTLRGLMIHHRVDPRAYMAYVHDIDLTVMAPDPALDAALAALPGPKTVFTNASRAHAVQVLERLGIARRFGAIFDIHDAGYLPKPEPETYRRFIADHGVVAAETALFDDTAANLAPAAALGMTTVLVRPGEDGIDNDPAAPHVHHVADDLAGWLGAVARARARPGPEVD